MKPKTNLRNRLRRAFAAVVAGAFVFGFVPASCHAGGPNVLRISTAERGKAQCTEHEWHSKAIEDEPASRLGVPLPKPVTIPPPWTPSVAALPSLVSVPRMLPADVVQRMRIPIRRFSIPFDVEGFLPYLMATRDA